MNSLFFFNLAFVFLFAICIGSFINMATYRIPLELSILTPRSYCNHCKKTLSIKALIPIFGYLLAKGKCFDCGVRVPLKYPLVELLCGAFCMYIFIYYEAHLYLPFQFSAYVKSGLFIQLVTAYWLFGTGLLLSLIDIDHYILPDVIVIPGIFVGLVLGAFNPLVGISQAILGALIGGFGLYAVSKLYELLRRKEGMGFGDVKYLAFLGAALGVYGVLFTIFLASILGSLFGIGMLLIKRQNLSTAIPFGPFLATAAVVYCLLSKNFTIL